MMLTGRYGCIALCFLATFCIYAERLGFSIAHTRMAKAAKLDDVTKGQHLSAFYFGYGVSQAMYFEKCVSKTT